LPIIIDNFLQGAPARCSIALQSLKNVLSSFAVSNRNNMFVYKDEGGNIFYMKIFEIISACQPRKISGLTPRGDLDDNVIGMKSRSSSVCSWNRYLNIKLSGLDKIYNLRHKIKVLTFWSHPLTIVSS